MFLKKKLSAAIAAWMVGSCAAQAEPLVVSDQQVVQSQLQGMAQQVQLQVPAGAVVQLRFAGAGLHLDLRDAQGQHIRRLAEDGRGVQTAMWRSLGAQQEQLWVVPAEKNLAPAPFSLQVLNTWQVQGEEQPKPEDTPMGPRLKKLQQALAQGHSTDAFWQQVQQQGTPLVEPWEGGQLLVTFLWRDQGNHNVRLFGSPSGDHNPLRKLGRSDVRWTSVGMDPRAR